MEFDREFHIAVKGFEMKVISYDPFVSQEDVDSVMEIIDDWDRVFKESDLISLNLPLNDKTRGIVSKKEFTIMKNAGYLSNCARGPLW